MSLFRKQVSNNQHDKMWGHVSLSQPVSYRTLSTLFVTLVVLVAIFLFSAQYHRKERVPGVILPEKGVIDLFSPGQLLITEKFVTQGEFVQQGQALFVLSAPVHLHNGQNQTQLTAEQLKKQISLFEQQSARAKTNEKQNLAYLTTSLTSQKEQLVILNRELIEAKAKANINQTRFNNHSAIANSGLISKNLLSQLSEQQHSLQQEVHATARLIKQAQIQLRQTEFEIKQLPVETQHNLDQIALAISERQQALTKLQADTDILITAPVAGHIAKLDVHQNQWLKTQQLMLSILPESSALYAELYVPTRAYGFIKEGQSAKVKLEAFPFEKFGFLNGKVTSKSTHTNSSTNPLLPQQSLNYKVKVQLDKQAITAYGQEVKLQSGMKLAADILIDKRNLMEWLLAPLYSLKD